jgi:hypothetical protein
LRKKYEKWEREKEQQCERKRKKRIIVVKWRNNYKWGITKPKG